MAKAKLLFTGDFVCIEEINKELFSNRFIDLINEQDIFSVNLEGPIVKNIENKVKKIGPVVFNNKVTINQIVKFDNVVFALANNHIYDYGREGLKNTIEYLQRKNISFVGAGISQSKIYKPLIKVVNGLKIGFINVAENGFGSSDINSNSGYAYILSDETEKCIENLKSQVDYIILISHIGAENWDIPLPEVRNIYKKFVDLGVDIIIGHHPHVPQGWEEYNGGLIFYSLGNFVFNINNTSSNYESYVVSIELNENEKTYSIIPIKFENNMIDIIDKDYNYLKEYIDNKEKYVKMLEENTIEAYNKIYKKCYYKVAVSYKENLKERIKSFIKRNFLKNKFDNIILFHNLNIETHLWICQRATKILYERKLKEWEQ